MQCIVIFSHVIYLTSCAVFIWKHLNMNISDCIWACAHSLPNHTNELKCSSRSRIMLNKTWGDSLWKPCSAFMKQRGVK